MNKAFCILLALFFYSCQNTTSNTTEKGIDRLTTLEDEIIQTLLDVDSLLSIDNGKFWNKKLNGPIIFIDPNTRVFYSNENNPTNDFKQLHNIYTDSLPPEINIANTAINWGGKRWSMVMLPLPSEQISRNNLIIHELFHRIQPSIGYENLQEQDNGHLDTYDGRLLLRLELQALEKALSSTSQATQLTHIKNALAFRHKRHKSLEVKNAENSLELNEGLAEYTALMLSGRTRDEMKSHLIQNKRKLYANPTFVRSFAYQTIPTYGYLLSSIKPNWHREINNITNLTDYFRDTFKINADDDLQIEQVTKQFDYEYQRIADEEKERENKRIEKIAALKTKFIEQPTLELPFQNMNISFDPTNLIPLENFGTVYPNLRVSDNWGILTVENGALLASNWSKVTITAPTEISDKVVSGNGWQLELNPNWKVKKTGKKFSLVNY